MPPKPKASARARVLAQWRGVDLTSLEKGKAVCARRAADVMPGLLKDLKLDSRRAEAEVGKVWNELIDPNVTAHAQPINLNKGTLFVNVDSDAWKYEIIRYHSGEVLKRMQYSFGENIIKKISWRVGLI